MLGALALSTVVAMAGALAVQPLLAYGRGRWAAAAWVAGATVTALLLLRAAPPGGQAWSLQLSGALLSGPALALAIAGLGVARLLGGRPVLAPGRS